MKRKITSFLFGLLFLVGFGILIYPTVSDQWNKYRQSQLITTYDKIVQEMNEEDFTEEWKRAKEFNDKIRSNDIYSDVFGSSNGELEKTEYWQVLNVGDNGLMGYVSIPKINLKLGVYHGTSEDVLTTGVGHINGSKLPIGGESNHSILAAHRGLPSARLFTDVDQLVKGDMIYVHILNEVFAYEVDCIYDMVDKDDITTLENALSIEEGQDYVTLFTCTPYGVNSHRLLVRGTRVPYVEEEAEVETTITETMVEAVQNYYMIYLIFGLSVTVLVIVIMKFLFTKQRRRRE